MQMKAWRLRNRGKRQGRDSLLAAAIGKDWKGKLSPAFYLIAIPLAFVSPWIANSLYLSNPIITFADDFESIIYNDRPSKHDMSPFGETNMPQVNQPHKKSKNYGR